MEIDLSLWPAASMLLPLPGLLLATLLFLAAPEDRLTHGGIFANREWRRWGTILKSDDLRFAAWALATLGCGEALGILLPARIGFMPAVMGWIGFIGIALGSQIAAILSVCRGRPIEGGVLSSALLLLCAPFCHDAALAVWCAYSSIWLAFGVAAFARPIRSRHVLRAPAAVVRRSVR